MMRVQVFVRMQYLRVGLVGGATATGAELSSEAAAAASAELVQPAPSLPASPAEPAGSSPSPRLWDPLSCFRCHLGSGAKLGSAWQGRAGVDSPAAEVLDDASKARQPGRGIVVASKNESSFSSASNIAVARRTLVSLPCTITHRLSLGTSRCAPVSFRIALTVEPFLPKTLARQNKSGSARFRQTTAPLWPSSHGPRAGPGRPGRRCCCCCCPRCCCGGGGGCKYCCCCW